jgi:hypothetical protein
VRQPLDQAVARLPPEQFRQSRHDCLEGQGLELALGLDRAGGHGFEQSQGERRVLQDQPLHVVSTQRADDRVLDGLGEAVVHRLPDAGHLAEDRCLRDLREHQLPPVRRHPIELSRSLLDQEHHLAGLARPVEDVPGAAARHADRVVERLQLRGREVAEQLVRLQVRQLAALGRARGP